MGWLRRTARRVSAARPGGAGRSADPAAVQHLTEFVQTRRGVEAFVEPKTAVTEVTVLLVAWDGEWTRRKVPSAAWAHSFAEHLQIPGYDAAVVGYPQRMRDYNARQRRRA